MYIRNKCKTVSYLLETKSKIFYERIESIKLKILQSVKELNYNFTIFKEIRIGL